MQLRVIFNRDVDGTIKKYIYICFIRYNNKFNDAGLITFIGLLAPHIGRMITKRNDFYTTIFSGIIGGIILIVADCLARSLSASEIPISILTTFIGAPFLAYLMSRYK